LSNPLIVREGCLGEAPRGGSGTLGGAVDFPIVFCYMFYYTGQHSAPAGSDGFY